MALPDKPLTRQEMYLSKIAGENTELPEKPLTREEMYLEAIAQGGGGGGTSNFNQLTNRPKLNGTEMNGDTDIKNFTSSAQGLVPAPAAGDTDKYLKSDGTWSEVDYAKEASVIKTSTTQSQTAEFIYRTTAGDMSIETGEATLMSIKGNAVLTGHQDEVRVYTTNFANPNTTAEVDWDTFIAWIVTRGWTDASPFTLTWTGNTGSEWSISNGTGGSTGDGSSALGITINGEMTVGDTMTIEYSPEVTGTIMVSMPTSFVATGYNQYDDVEGYAKVIGDNQYRIVGTADSWEFAPADGSTSVVITLDNGKYTPPTDGVLIPTNPSGDILVALVWSGIRDNDPYEPYETSTITIPTVDEDNTTLPTGEYGMPKVGDVADELNFSERIYIKRIGQYDYSEANLETVQAMGVDYIFDLTNIFYVLETPVTYTLASTVSGVYTANDFGTEEFTGSDVPLEATIIYGNNLVDKLRNLADIQTIGNNLTLVNGLLSAAGGAAYKVLTDADYNYSSNTRLALWLLPDGFYKVDTVAYYVQQNANSRLSGDNCYIYIISTGVGTSPLRKSMFVMSTSSASGSSGSDQLRVYRCYEDGRDAGSDAFALYSDLSSLKPVDLSYSWYGRNWPNTGTKDGLAIFKVIKNYYGDDYIMKEKIKLYITETYAIDDFTGYAKRVIDRTDTNNSGYYIFDTNHGIEYFALTTNQTGVKTTLKKFEGTDIV